VRAGRHGCMVAWRLILVGETCVASLTPSLPVRVRRWRVLSVVLTRARRHSYATVSGGSGNVATGKCVQALAVERLFFVARGTPALAWTARVRRSVVVWSSRCCHVHAPASVFFLCVRVCVRACVRAHVRRVCVRGAVTPRLAVAPPTRPAACESWPSR
jgi:hypothetical protein